jgi:hypothetical protein
MLKIIIETSSYVHLVVGFKIKQSWYKFILPKLSLTFDELHFFGNPPPGKLLLSSPHGKFIEIHKDILRSATNYAPPTNEQLEDLRIAMGDEPGGEGGTYAYFGTRVLLDYAKKNASYFYVLPGLREGFINFCLKYELDYLPRIKESFLLCSIIEFLFEEEIPAFDPVQSEEILKKYVDYKGDLQKGILIYLKKFEGSYALSKEQQNYLKETLANDEQRLLDFLQPENLKKYKISKLGILSEGVSFFVPLPLGTLIDIGKEVKKVRDFKKANLDFILSLTILKKMTNVGKVERSVNCAVCAISPAEIEKMTNAECDEIMYNRELCMEHMVARLDLKKRFRLYGKERLREMKRLGDSSIWMNPKKE